MHRSPGLFSCAVTLGVLVALVVPATSWAAPGVTSIEPTSGSTAGGTTVTIKGTGFEDSASVRIGVPVAAVTFVSTTELKVETEAHAAGKEEVVVADLNGTSSAGPKYTYQEECAGSATTETTGTGSATKSVTRSIAPGSGMLPGSITAESPHGVRCWVEQAYPFGSEGGPVKPNNSVACGTAEGDGDPCYLKVESMAFRAWNRGLAVTAFSEGGEKEAPFSVWRFNGTAWAPAPQDGFPGTNKCGAKIVWAGEDYWVFGDATLCRFDAPALEWQAYSLPAATAERIGTVTTKLTSAACFAWNNCWFFGPKGAVVHWSGAPPNEPPLVDESPNPLDSLLQGEYTAAVAREGPAGEPLGLAVGTTSEEAGGGEQPLPALGSPPAQLYGSDGTGFSPLAFTPFTIGLSGDPYRTDLEAVDLDSAGQGWVAGDPAGLRAPGLSGGSPEQPTTRQAASQSEAQYSPLQPVSTPGAVQRCEGPPAERFTYRREDIEGAGAFLWSSIAVLPVTGEALAAGKLWPAQPGSGSELTGEPDIASASCSGTTTVTTFTSPNGSGPADFEGSVNTLSATAPNDAWAATTQGERPIGAPEAEPPHLYRLRNGESSKAPEAQDEGARSIEVQEESHETIVIQPPPEPPETTPPPTVTTHTVALPAAVYDVKAKLHTIKRGGQVYLSLYLTFKLRRAVTLGAQALRHGSVVSVARPRHFAGHSGQLILSLNRKHWPTNVKFIT